MGKAARLKKERAKLPAHPKPMDPALIEAYNRGKAIGIQLQREQDNELLLKMLSRLDEIPGVGDKTAWKIREFFLQQFSAK